MRMASAAAGAVRLEEDHHVAQRALLAPRPCQRRPPLRAEAFDLGEAMRVLVEHLQRVEPERRHDALRELRPDALDEARGEVLLEPGQRVRRELDERLDAELLAVLGVDDDAGRGRGRARRAASAGKCRRPRAGRPPVDRELEDAEARLGALEGDALDDTLDDRRAWPSASPGALWRQCLGAVTGVVQLARPGHACAGDDFPTLARL